MIYLSSMMKIKNIIIPVVSISLLLACDSTSDQFQMKKGDRVLLKDFPDSSYVANLDSILKDENVLDIKPKEQKQFTMSLADLKLASSKAKTNLDQTKKIVKPMASQASFSKEEFAKIFLASMNAAKSGNQGVFEVKVTRDGESIISVLKRAYKTSAVSGVPNVMLKFGLSGLNPGLDIEKLKGGQSIKLPKLK